MASSHLLAAREEREREKEKENEEEEPDLFDYFDPLLSPHAYPNGISPSHKPEQHQNVLRPDWYEEESNRRSQSFGFLSPRPLEEVLQGSTTANQGDNTGKKEQPDLFEYFDPRQSPHQYPNGISPNRKAFQVEKEEEQDGRYNPLQFPSYARQQAPPSPSQPGSKSSSTKTVGVLLMDHGSKNAASNERLQHLAELYQFTMRDNGSGGSGDSSTSTSKNGPNVVVVAAHMELASPSIPEGLQTLVNQGVDEIICHPFFLSPGRHVQQDIPRIVQNAIEELQIQIPLRITDPIGSNTQLMIGAIHSLVKETSDVLKKPSQL